jgi:hypothetical protein
MESLAAMIIFNVPRTSKSFRYFNANSNRIVASPEPICFPLPICMNRIYAPISTASNVLIVKIRVSFYSGFMRRGLGLKLAYLIYAASEPDPIATFLL